MKFVSKKISKLIKEIQYEIPEDLKEKIYEENILILEYADFCVKYDKKFLYRTKNTPKEEKELQIPQNKIRNLKSGDLVAIVEYQQNGKRIKDFFKAKDIE